MKTNFNNSKNNELNNSTSLSIGQYHQLNKIDMQRIKDITIVTISALFFCCVLIESLI